MFGRNKEDTKADAAASQPTEPQADPNAPIYLTPNEVLGAIVRNLQEAIAYCMQDPRAVHPMVVMAYLDRAFGWTQKLPEPQMQDGTAPNGGGKPTEDGKRAN